MSNKQAERTEIEKLVKQKIALEKQIESIKQQIVKLQKELLK